MREIINYHVMDRINLFRNNIVIMYEPELEHEFCDAMTINTPTQPRVYIKKGVNNDFFLKFPTHHHRLGKFIVHKSTTYQGI